MRGAGDSPSRGIVIPVTYSGASNEPTGGRCVFSVAVTNAPQVRFSVLIDEVFTHLPIWSFPTSLGQTHMNGFTGASCANCAKRQTGHGILGQDASVCLGQPSHAPAPASAPHDEDVVLCLSTMPCTVQLDNRDWIWNNKRIVKKTADTTPKRSIPERESVPVSQLWRTSVQATDHGA